MAINKDGSLISITKKSITNGWNGLCALQMTLVEQYPVNFKLILNQSNGDCSGIQIAVRSCLERNLSSGQYSGGLDVNGFVIGEYINGMITLKGSTITTTIGHKTMCQNSKIRSTYVFIHIMLTTQFHFF